MRFIELLLIFFIFADSFLLDWVDANSNPPPLVPKKKRNKRTHPPPLPGYTCETSMSFEKYKNWFLKNGETLCEPETSPSQIICSSRIGRYAFFCVGYNIISLPIERNYNITRARTHFYGRLGHRSSMLNNNDKINELNELADIYFNQNIQPDNNDPYTKYSLDVNHFVAGCFPKKVKFENRNTLREFLRIMSPRSPLRTGQMIFNVKLFNELKSKPETRLSNHPLTYVATGDCATGNPGHCIADPHHLLIMQKVLDKEKADTQVILHSGFGKNNYMNGASNDIAMIEDWWPFVEPHSVGSVIDDVDKGRSTLFPILGLSADGWNGPHWRHYSDYGDCNRTSDVLLEARSAIFKFWGLKDQLPPMPLNGLEGLKALQWPKSITNNEGLKPRPWKLLWLVRTVKDRVILNINETISSIEMTYGRDVICEGVDLGKLSYQEQLKKAVESDIIIAMHGGAILQVVRWLSPTQHVIEILPDSGPGSACFLAKMMGVPYFFNKCTECTTAQRWTGRMVTYRAPTPDGEPSKTVKEMGKWVGNINVNEIVEIVGNVLRPTRESVSISHNIDCFET